MRPNLLSPVWYKYITRIIHTSYNVGTIFLSFNPILLMLTLLCYTERTCDQRNSFEQSSGCVCRGRRWGLACVIVNPSENFAGTTQRGIKAMNFAG